MRQALSPDFDAGAFVGAVTEFGDVKNLVEIVSAGRFDGRDFLSGGKNALRSVGCSSR